MAPSGSGATVSPVTYVTSNHKERLTNMSSTTTRKSPADQVVGNLLTIVGTLTVHKQLLDRWSYDRQRAGADEDERTYVSIDMWSEDQITFDVHGPRAAIAMTELRRAIGGKWVKSASDYEFAIRREIDGVTIKVCSSRAQVCTRRVVGTKLVEHPARPAVEARTEEREIVEWDCGAILPKSATAGEED